MKITTILFDLDGTLLPMDQEAFIKGYFRRLAEKLAPLGYESHFLFQPVGAGIEAMIKGDGRRRNEEVFWDCFLAIAGEQAMEHKGEFEDFYRNEFQQVRHDCGYTPEAKLMIDGLKENGFRLVLATNPLFPAVATYSRTRWAGLCEYDFALITTYENSCYCKPNLHYYEEILNKLGIRAEECLMVGNDVGEDMIAEQLGMRVFLLTPCLINRRNEKIERYPHGDFKDLHAYIDSLIEKTKEIF